MHRFALGLIVAATLAGAGSAHARECMVSDPTETDLQPARESRRQNHRAVDERLRVEMLDARTDRRGRLWAEVYIAEIGRSAWSTRIHQLPLGGSLSGGEDHVRTKGRTPYGCRILRPVRPGSHGLRGPPICTVKDPTGTPLNVRIGPNGKILPICAMARRSRSSIIRMSVARSGRGSAISRRRTRFGHGRRLGLRRLSALQG